jgi:hypothetical protein
MMSWSDSLSALASGLALWPGVFLLAGGATKALDVRAGESGTGTVLARALPTRVPLRAAWTAVAGAELAVGGLVLAGVALPFSLLAAAAGLAAAGLLSLWGVRHAPDTGCGCFGAARSEPVSPRTVVRAGVLCALALVAMLGGDGWFAALSHPLAVAAVLAVGAGLAAATPELRPRNARVRLREAVWAHRPAPPRRTLERLRRSPLWADAREYLAADAPSEQWREGCWRYLAYPATYDGEAATAVFALYLGRDRASDGVAFVAEREQRVLGRLRGRKVA